MAEKAINTNEVSIESSTEIAVIDERTIRDKIYIVRGVQVMLDFELAEIYGYSTTAFNQQVKNNAAKFEGDDFSFYLTQDEFRNLISKNLTSSWGGRRKPPRVFTESGIYMLMTVLRGDLAIQQSRALIRTFRAMKDYIVENQNLLSQRDLLRLTIDNTAAIREMRSTLTDQQQMLSTQQKLLMEHDDKLSDILEQLSDTVHRSEISPVLLQFNQAGESQEYLLLNGQPAKADETYIGIYAKAKKSIYLIDNYINIKTLRLFQDVQPGVVITVFSDNVGNRLHASDVSDFQTEFPHITTSFQQTAGIMHDRFIVLDYGEDTEDMYLCGASSKDAAVNRTTAISQLTSASMRAAMHSLIDRLKRNPSLVLR